MEYLAETVACLKHLRASRHVMRCCCSAEASEVTPQGRAWMENFCYEKSIRLQWREKPPDFGSNMNCALQMSDAPYRYLLLDDWSLQGPLDLSPHCDWLDANPKFALIRYSWSFREHVTKWLADIEGTDLREIDPNSKYFFSDHPSLRRGSYLDEYGPYIENTDLGGPEHAMTRTLRGDGWRVAATRERQFLHNGHLSSVPEHWNPAKPIDFEGVPE